MHDLKGIPPRKINLIEKKVEGNMGCEIDARGTHLFFSRATWELKMTFSGFTVGRLLDSDIWIADKTKHGFVYNHEKTARIMKQINTPDLEYAASISTDGLDLFFTRFSIQDYQHGNLRSRIMYSTRRDSRVPFGVPRLV